MSRTRPQLSEQGKQAIAQYGVHLRTQLDMQPATIRSYLADLTLFGAWCETTWTEGVEVGAAFSPANVVTPTITHYRSYLQTVARLKPATINRALISQGVRPL